MRIRSLALLAFLGLALTACDSTDDFEIGGTYSGTFEDSIGFNDAELTIPDTPNGDTFTFQYFLSETDGDGTVFDEYTVSGTGTYDHPEITLTIEDETTTGTVSDDGDTIRIDDGEGEIITLTR